MNWLANVFGQDTYDGGGLWSMTGSQQAASLNASNPHDYPAANSYGSYGHSILQGGMTAGRMVSVYMSGRASQDASNRAAAFADLSFDQEAKASEERAKNIREQTLSIAASQRVGLAASGVDITSGSSARIARNTVGKGEHNLDIERDNARIRMQKAGYRAAQYRARGRSAKNAGLMKAIGMGANFAMDLYQRG